VQGEGGMGGWAVTGVQAGGLRICFGWALNELSTARKHAIGVVTVVFNDGAYGNVRRTQVEDFGGRIVGSDLLNPDFVALAESFEIGRASGRGRGEARGVPGGGSEG